MRTLTTVAALLLSSIPAFGKYYEAQNYNVTLQLDSQGVLTVTETADFRFVAGPFTYVFRDIAATETDGIGGVLAWMDGRPCGSGTGPGEAEIHGSSPVKVLWHFAEILSGNHTFTVQYRAAGTIRPAGGAQRLIWRVFPQQDNYSVRASDIVLEYPADIKPRSVRLRSGAPDFKIGRGRATAGMANPTLGDGMILEAEFPAGSFSGPAPAWQAAQVRKARDFGRGIRDGAAVSAILVVLACLWMFRIRGAARSEASHGGGGLRVTSPPNWLAPALAGWVIGRPGRLGTLIDLARRGVLRMEVAPKGFLGSRQFQVVWCDTAAKLAPHEAVLLQIVFGAGETTINLQKFFAHESANGKFVAAIRGESEAAGWIDESRVRARTTLLVGGAIGLVAGLLLLTMGVVSSKSVDHSYLGAGALVTGGAVIAAGVLALILGGIQPVLSDLGVAAAAQWKAFARYLTEVASGRAALPGPAELERWLPYAAAFRVLPHLLKLQEKRDGYAQPAWFQAIQAASAADSAAFVSYLYTCDTSSSSGGGFGGGGGGASGGGASGAG